MNNEIRVNFSLLGGGNQVIYLNRNQKQYIKDLMHDFRASSYVIEHLDGK